MAAQLTWSEFDALRAQRSAELATGPSAFLGQQPAQGLGDGLPPLLVRLGTGSVGPERGLAPVAESLEHCTAGVRVAVEVVGDAWRRPARVGQQNDLQTIADRGRQGGPAQNLKFGTKRSVELDTDHTSLYASTSGCLAASGSSCRLDQAWVVRAARSCSRLWRSTKQETYPSPGLDGPRDLQTE